MAKRKHDPGYKLPEVINPDRNCCICIPIPNDFNHKMAFLGQLDELGYWWNWERDDEHKGTQAAQVWRNIVECIREELDMSGCGCGGAGEITNRRYTEDGHLEVSYDGGETWENGDALDPRFTSPIYSPYPGADGEEKRCRGANSFVAFIRGEQARSSEVLGTAGGIAGLIAAVATGVAATGVGLIPSIIIALMGAVLNRVIAAGETEFDGSFTTLFWDELLCSVYCNLEDDATFTEAGWQALMVEVAGNSSYPANEWTAYIIKTMGLVGATNASLMGNIGTASCDGCECEEPCNSIYEPYSPLHGTIIERGDDFIIAEATDPGNGIGYIILTSEVLGECCQFLTVDEISGAYNGGFRIDCGQPYDEEAWTAPLNIGCWQHIQLQATVGAVLKINFSHCA